MTTAPDRTHDEAAIARRIERFAQAIRARDIDAVLSTFAPELVSFDLGPPLQHGGGETFARRWRDLFDAYAGSIDYEIRDPVVTADGDVAFSRSLNRIAGTMRDGRRVERWLRWTAGWRRLESGWRIVHEHVSVPADLRDGKALLDLEPSEPAGSAPSAAG